MKRVITMLIFLLPVLGWGLSYNGADSYRVVVTDGDEPKVMGYYDDNGWKQGYFIIYGKDVPGNTEYPPEGRVEEGNYKDDRKTGEWITYHTDGKTPRTIGVYVDGRPNGAYSKYDPNGAISEKGTYSNKKQTGDFFVYYANGQPQQQKTFNAEGKEHGTTTFFYENGQPQYVVNKVNGVPTGEATRYWEDGSVKEIIVFGPDGQIQSTTVVNAEPPVKTDTKTGSGGPSGVTGKTKDGKKFQPDGYNKVYNDDDELWMDGDFRGGKLWNGELYKYDSDGILLKIEIWKEGAYHSDGQL